MKPGLHLFEDYLPTDNAKAEDPAAKLQPVDGGTHERSHTSACEVNYLLVFPNATRPEKLVSECDYATPQRNWDPPF